MYHGNSEAAREELDIRTYPSYKHDDALIIDDEEVPVYSNTDTYNYIESVLERG